MTRTSLLCAICRRPAVLMAMLTISVVVGVAAAQDSPSSGGAGEPAETNAAGDGIPDSWYYRDPITGKRIVALQELEGAAAPWLKGGRWHGEEQKMSELRGKVVVLNFWSTACGECLLNMRGNNELASRYADDPFVMIGVHHQSDGVQRYEPVLRQFRPSYPMCVDTLGSTYRAWRVDKLPTYAVIDKHGVVRAIGIKHERVDDLVEVLLKEEFDPSAVAQRPIAFAPGDDSPDTRAETPEKAPIPTEWLEGSETARASFDELMAESDPPAIESATWINSEPMTLDELTGKVVMLDFWGTWCAKCIRSIPEINALHEKYKDDGLVIIGVCNKRNVEQMEATVSRHGIEYPVCADADGTMVEAYRVRGFPDYYFIDRHGDLRIADCGNRHIEDAIRMLLAEPGPGETRDVGFTDISQLGSGGSDDDEDNSKH